MSTAKKTFHLVLPDLGRLPPKYRPFVVSPVRRVYIDNGEQASAALENEVKELERKVAAHVVSEWRQAERYQALIASLNADRQAIRVANQTIMFMKEDMQRTKAAHHHAERQLNSRIAQLHGTNHTSNQEAQRFKAAFENAQVLNAQLEAKLKRHTSMIHPSVPNIPGGQRPTLERRGLVPVCPPGTLGNTSHPRPNKRARSPETNPRETIVSKRPTLTSDTARQVKPLPNRLPLSAENNVAPRRQSKRLRKSNPSVEAGGSS